MDKRLAIVKMATKALVEDETSGGIYLVPEDYSVKPDGTFTLGDLGDTLNLIKNYLITSLSAGVLRDNVAETSIPEPTVPKESTRDTIIDAIVAVQKFYDALYGKDAIIDNMFAEAILVAKRASGTEMLTPEQYDAIMSAAEFTGGIVEDLSPITQYGPSMRIPVFKSRFASTRAGRDALKALIVVRDIVLQYQDPGYINVV